MRPNDFIRWEKFLEQAYNDVITVSTAMKRIKDSQGVLGKGLEYIIYILRGMRKWLRK